LNQDGSGRLQDILWELERASRSALGETFTKPDSLSVEHVLPQSWDEGWSMPDGTVSRYDAGTPAAQTRNALLDTLGNLTLVTGGLNRSLGKSGFTDKRAKLGEHSYLALNKWICNRQDWNEVAIHARGDLLADLALQIWPTPDHELGGADPGLTAGVH
jgi:hypothetical protein